MRDNFLYIAGAWRGETGQSHTQADSRSGAPFSRTWLARPGDVDDALAAAAAAAPAVEAAPRHERARWLDGAADALQARAEAVARLLVAECAKPLATSRQEVARSVETLRASAMEAMRLAGEVVPMDASVRGEGKLGFAVQVPVGVVAAITPFNAPLNLLCHKLGPALAAGNALVVKPDPRAASCAAELLDILDGLGLPAGAVNMVHGGREAGEQLVVDARVDLVSFTGGRQAAHRIVGLAGLKRVLLELGGNAGNIVCADADLDLASRELARGAFTHAGQSCIGVQRIYVEQAAYDAFMERFLSEVRGLAVGDPGDAATEVGPMIDAAAAERLLGWIGEAVGQGAVVHCGGQARGPLLEPTVIGGVSRAMRVVCEEAFGPVVTVAQVPDLETAVAAVNDSRYGLQAGVFTASLANSLYCARRLKVGGVVVNGTSNYRVDHQPYGGVKESGVGREGPAYAVRAMSETRMVVFQ